MSSYFDKASSAVAQAHIDYKLDSEDFVGEVVEIEWGVIRHVNLVTGDREFSDILRQRIQGVIALYAIKPLPGLNDLAREDAALYARTLGISSLLAKLHSLFHLVASMRISTRFGGWSDNPEADLKARDSHDSVPLVSES